MGGCAGEQYYITSRNRIERRISLIDLEIGKPRRSSKRLYKMNILILATVAWFGATCTFARSVNVVDDARLIEFIRILDQGTNPIEIKNGIEFWFEKPRLI